MNKNLLILTVLLLLPTLVMAQKNQSGQSMGQTNRVQDPTIHAVSVAPRNKQYQNVNQNQVQNMGEEQNLQTPFGKQIKELAQSQSQAQDEIEVGMASLQNKSKIAKVVFGPDYKTIKNLKMLNKQNQNRIQVLTKLANQTENIAEETQLRETVQLLTAQNAALDEQIVTEEAQPSFFGWFFRFFNR